MRNTLIIAGGIVVGLAVLAMLWWYLLIDGGPQDIALENPFASGGEVTVPVVEPTAEEPVVASNAALRRIHPRPVAGASFISEEERTLVYLAELGTGHLYAYDPSIGTSTRLSGITVPRTTDAIWSPDGARVILTTQGDGGSTRHFLSTLVPRSGENGTTTTLETIELDRAARNFAFSADGAGLYFTLPTTGGSAGYAYDPQTGTREVRFTSPLRDVRVVWGAKPSVYAAPSADADGYAFRTDTGARIASGLRGLMLTPAGDRMILTYEGENGLVSRSERVGGTPLALTVFPEKCAADPLTAHILWCAAPAALPAGEYPDAWYQGIVTLEDELWQLNTVTGSATLVSIPVKDAGTSIDATDFSVSGDGELLLFTNKRDGGLWIQEVN